MGLFHRRRGRFGASAMSAFEQPRRGVLEVEQIPGTAHDAFATIIGRLQALDLSPVPARIRTRRNQVQSVRPDTAYPVAYDAADPDRVAFLEAYAPGQLEEDVSAVQLICPAPTAFDYFRQLPASGSTSERAAAAYLLRCGQLMRGEASELVAVADRIGREQGPRAIRQAWDRLTIALFDEGLDDKPLDIGPALKAVEHITDFSFGRASEAKFADALNNVVHRAYSALQWMHVVRDEGPEKANGFGPFTRADVELLVRPFTTVCGPVPLLWNVNS